MQGEERVTASQPDRQRWTGWKDRYFDLLGVAAVEALEFLVESAIPLVDVINICEQATEVNRRVSTASSTPFLLLRLSPASWCTARRREYLSRVSAQEEKNEGQNVGD